MEFSEEQVKRYSRHILLAGVGGKGQKKLLESRVLIVGLGGLGSPVALYLAAAGVGTLGLMDDDTVELSNLQRQIIHHTSDTGKLKVDSAAEKIAALNPDVTVVKYPHKLNAENAWEIFPTYDFIVEGTDNFPAKFLVNDGCVLMNKPFSIGGILQFQGSTLTHAGNSACYRCVFREPPPRDMVPTCSQAGVLGAVAGMLGTVQAAETLKYLLSIGDNLCGRMMMFDALSMEWNTVAVKAAPDCPVCGEKTKQNIKSPS